ncbi:hypothetical protein MFERI13461_00829 [Mycoplasma feriruminatoris]|uniref:Uncharacterized protein n=1 Tax=Mycoplasma feriruminatoris TaxID=1179777 RepID=A0AAX3THD7_9MOLU|nr:hypothetical protein [Mycoplasma feriruminatoris]UKS54532.1 LPXTG cell wall anchor domain protein [Mycoplasma feriruminatoris]WFQ91391.1 hypothetical protein MFERI13461_00829 [Mycoplasma feriruminatoris]WFQ92218.1 hypothetical protein MFERI14815_00835 [Mycoplasma feriruminatoris]WFQ93090.1 hypothetical protein MFERI14822_00883 [Mycoplasma feriruminatoris]WFQ96388.1 hypothetical protein MFERI15568_00825 [Mycoplasma feriruminatoris]
MSDKYIPLIVSIILGLFLLVIGIIIYFITKKKKEQNLQVYKSKNSFVSIIATAFIVAGVLVILFGVISPLLNGLRS